MKSNRALEKARKAIDVTCGNSGLVCKNGSTCDQVTDGDHLHSHLDSISPISSLIDHHKHFCECSEGYSGNDCSIEIPPLEGVKSFPEVNVESIPKSECVANRADLVHSCFYGSKCVEIDNKYGLLDRYCDCSRVDLEEGSFAAGLMCQYKSTSVCVSNIGGTKATDQFCVNGGECKAIVGPEETHPGCSCDSNFWEGPHCEFAKGVLFDDALDLFQQRLHLLKSKTTRVIDDLAWVDSGPYVDAPAEGDPHTPNQTYLILSGIVAGFCAAVLLVLVIIKFRKSKHQYEKAEIVKETGCNYPAEPLPETFDHRKSEVEETDVDMTLVPQVGSEHQIFPSNERMVEMLDSETSEMLEAQFNFSPIEDENDDSIEESDFGSEEIADCEHVTTARITANSGMYPLIKNSSCVMTGNEAYEDSNSRVGVMSMDGGEEYYIDEDETSVDDGLV